MRGRGIILTAALVVAVGSGIGVAFAVGEGPIHLRTEGANYFEANAFIQSTLRFNPGNLEVESGDTIRFEHRDATLEPHTLTLVKQGDLPTSVDEVFACTVCEEALEGHFGQGIDPRLEDDDDDEFGLDGPGDSLLILEPGGEITSPVTAPVGTTMYFLCAIHPWMQGRIKVTG